MKHRHLWLGTAVIALLTLSSPASAQYISRYQSSDSPNVEVNLDVLNQRAEQEYKAQHDVAAEPLAPVAPAPAYVPVTPPKAAPAPVVAPVAVPVAVPVTARVQPVPPPMQHALPPAMPSYPPATPAAMPAPQQKRRLLKPVFTAGTPAAQPAPQTAPATQYDVRHTELPPSDPSELMPDTSLEENLAVEEAVAEPPEETKSAPPVRMASIPLPRHKPEGTKRSWSAVDDTPAPAYLADAPKPPVVMAAVEPKKAPAPSAIKNEAVENETAELKADEELPPPAPEKTAEKAAPAADAAPGTAEKDDTAKDDVAEAADTPPPVMMAQADIAAPAATLAPERAPIISHRPRLSDEMPDHVPAQPLVTQAYPTAPIKSQKPALSNEAKITPPPATPPVVAPVAPIAEPVTTPPAAVDDDWSAPAPTRPAAKKPEAKRPSLIVTQGDDNKPAIPAPLPDVTAPVATQNEAPLAVPPGNDAVPDLSQLPPPDESAMNAPEPMLNPPDALPVVPTLADLTLDFPGNSSDLTSQSQRKLDAVIAQLNDSSDGRLQVRGYASGDGSTATARRIALSRVLAVRSYLMDKGIKPARVDVHARGALTDGDTRAADRVDLIFAR